LRHDLETFLFLFLNRFAIGDSLPFFSLVGCSLASGNGLLTKEDELEGICWEIREAVGKYQSKLETDNGNEPVQEDLKLSDLNIGPFLQKGCNAVVYGVNFKKDHQEDFRIAHQIKEDPILEPQSFQRDNFGIASSSRFVQNFGGSVDNLRFHTTLNPARVDEPLKSSEGISKTVKFNENVEVKETPSQALSASPSSSVSSIPEMLLQDPPLSIYQYPWALKMMFNYDIQSNALTILRAMYKETIPARNRRDYEDVGNWERAIMEQTTSLPAHPNIVLMPAFFCDQIPDLKHANDLYPSAMPPRLNPTSGYGRNMSLFLLMKRYNSNLREYLADNDLSIRTRIILFAQLLEATAFINSYGIAHRDLKSDNILVDTMSDSHLPLIVISDFGCCLADKRHGLRLPYTSYEIDKGGNVNLMAPEIITKQPSMFSVLNYTKSDLWACGTIAYEIFGSENPFYDSSLRNVDYIESMLPEIGEEVPLIVRRLIANLLQRNPTNRLSCDVAANVLELYLWAPSSWIKYGRNPSNNEVKIIKISQIIFYKFI
jgi:hypothetical protein